jgi:hypothetical protein
MVRRSEEEYENSGHRCKTVLMRGQTSVVDDDVGIFISD